MLLWLTLPYSFSHNPSRHRWWKLAGAHDLRWNNGLPATECWGERQACFWVAELQQGKPSSVKQTNDGIDKGRESTPSKEGVSQDRRAEPGVWGTPSKSLHWSPSVSCITWSWKRSPCCTTAPLCFYFYMKLSWLCSCHVQYSESELNTSNILWAIRGGYASSISLSESLWTKLEHLRVFIHVSFAGEPWYS